MHLDSPLWKIPDNFFLRFLSICSIITAYDLKIARQSRIRRMAGQVFVFGDEVVNMLIAEYDYETDIRVKQDEAREAGREEGREQGREEGREEGRNEGRVQGTELKVIQQVLRKLQKSCTVEQIADALEEPEEKISRIVRIAQKYAPEYDEKKILEELMASVQV